MNQELDYAEMLEIPVNTVNVTKKKSIFKRKQKTQPQEDLKERVVESVNERVGAYAYAEDLTEEVKPAKQRVVAQRDRAGAVLWAEAVLVGLIAIGIFVTNILVPNTVINTFLGTFAKTAEPEPVYSELKLTSAVGAFSEAQLTVTPGGVMCFTVDGCVYPVCDGKVARIYEDNGLCTMEIAHTSTFTSVITGLTGAYSAVGTAVKSNIPVGYSNGENEVRVTLYDNGAVLNCFTLSGNAPVWKA